MSSTTEEPSIMQKTHTQHYPFTMPLPASQPWIPGLVNLFTNGSYGNAGFCGGHFLASRQGSSSSGVSPPMPVSAQAPYEISIRNVASTFYMAGAQVVATSVVAPFERVRLLMQSQGEMISSGRLHKPYKGMRDCFARTIRNEGIMSLWRGNTAEVIRGLIREAVRPAFHNFFYGVFQVEGHEYGYWDSLACDLAGSILAQAATLSVLCPLRYANTRLATDILSGNGDGKRQFSGIFDVISKTLKSDGLPGLYRGYNIQFVARELSIHIQEGLRSTFKPGMMLLCQSGFLGCVAAVSGPPLFAYMIIYPMDTISRRMMMRSGEPVKYSSSVDAFNRIVKNERSQVLYKGAAACLVDTVINEAAFLFFALHAGSVPAATLSVKWSDNRD